VAAVLDALAGDQDGAIRSGDPGCGGKARCQRTKEQAPPRYVGMEFKRTEFWPLLHQPVVLGRFGWMLDRSRVDLCSMMVPWPQPHLSLSRYREFWRFHLLSSTFKRIPLRKTAPYPATGSPAASLFSVIFEEHWPDRRRPVALAFLCDTPFAALAAASRFPTLSSSPHWVGSFEDSCMICACGSTVSFGLRHTLLLSTTRRSRTSSGHFTVEQFVPRAAVA
jgi:hypothetical protein